MAPVENGIPIFNKEAPSGGTVKIEFHDVCFVKSLIYYINGHVLTDTTNIKNGIVPPPRGNGTGPGP